MDSRFRKAATAFLAVVLVLVVSGLHAQSPSEIRFRNVPFQEDITSMTQTTDGYIWLGTRVGGLQRFDGEKTMEINPENHPALSQYHVVQVVAGDSGELYARTRNGQLLKVRNDEVVSLSGDLKASPVLSTAMVFHPEGHLVFCNFQREIISLKGATNEVVVSGSNITNSITQLAIDNDTRLWATTFNTLYLLDQSEFVEVEIFEGEIPQIAPAIAGGIWVATSNEIRRYRDALPHRELYPLPAGESPTEITAIQEDSKGNLWIGTRSSGLLRLRNGVFSTFGSEQGLSGSRVTSIIEDREGILWVGTRGGGLNRISKSQFDIFKPLPGKREVEIQSITTDADDSIWIGTDGAGLFQITGGETNTFNRSKGLNSSSIRAVLVDRSGTVWAGSAQNGLYYMRNGRFRSARKEFNLSADRIPQQIRSLYQDSEGILWIGDQELGLFRHDGETFSSFSDAPDKGGSLPNPDIRAILKDQKGILWVGTGGGGLSRYIDGHWETVTTRDGLPSNFVNCLYEDELGNIWVGTMAGLGLVRLDAPRLVPSNALPIRSIYQIFEDQQNNLWIGAAEGILRVRRADVLSYIEGIAQGSLIPSVLYDERDGLNSSECNGPFQPFGAQTRDGSLLFPTGNWISSIQPGQLQVNERPPKVVIESLKVNGVDFSTRGRIQLSHKADSILIYYNGLSYASPGRTRFRYRLDPVETDWVEAPPNKKVAQYDALPPGEYTFRVIAANKDNLWNETGQTLRFTILPPFWVSWWFLSACVAGVVFAARYLSFTELRGRLHAAAQEHALEAERARIAKDMHDDIGASLTQISLLTEVLQRHESFPDKERAMAEQIASKARETTQKVDEIVWAVNPKNDTLDRLASYIVHLGEEFFEYSEIRCRLDIPSTVPSRPLSSDIRHNVVMAIKEALNNAQKYSSAKEIWILMKVASSSFEIEVKDDGTGFDVGETFPNGNGLQNMRKRIEEVGGEFHLSSIRDEGTCVRIRVPH